MKRTFKNGKQIISVESEIIENLISLIGKEPSECKFGLEFSGKLSRIEMVKGLESISLKFSDLEKAKELGDKIYSSLAPVGSVWTSPRNLEKNKEIVVEENCMKYNWRLATFGIQSVTVAPNNKDLTINFNGGKCHVYLDIDK